MSGLEKHTWATLRDRIMQINPEFCSAIDELSPSDDHTLYIGEYPYGALLLDKGIFKIFNDENQLVPLNHSSIHSTITEDLSYTGTIPMGMVSKNSIETFLLDDNRTIPSSFYTGGDMISLWRVLEDEQSYQEGSLWNISSGAKTICMLPKVTDKTCYDSLKRKYDLKLPIPRSLNDHWAIFEKIASHEQFSQLWHSEIVFFSKAWFSHKDDKRWSIFYQYILRKAWKDSTFKRNQFIFEFAFSKAQKNKNIKPNPYLADTIKHLIGIGTGEIPGLKPATNDIVAPVSGLQKAYLEDYGLKKYMPVIMHLHHFSLEQSIPVYYSLEMPTTAYFSPRSSAALSKMVDMRELKHILEAFFSETLKGNLMIEKTPLYYLAKNVCYDFYHRDNDQYSEISNATDLIKIDPVFKKILSDSKDLSFPEFSPFFKGCISIKKAG